MGTTCNLATITKTRGRRITRKLLQLHLCIPTVIIAGIRVLDNRLEFGALRCVLRNGFFALELAVLHGNLSHYTRSLFLERKAEGFQQFATFIVGTGSGGNGDIKSTDLVDSVVLDLGENDLLTHTHAVVTATIEGLGIQTAEVTNAGYRNVNQTIKEIPHTLTAQGNFTTDRPTFTDFKARYGFTCQSDNGFLTCQALKIRHGIFNQLLVTDRFADTHIQGDLFDTRHLHDVLVAELFLQGGYHFLTVLLFHVKHRNHHRLLVIDDFFRGLKDPHFSAVFLDLEAYAIGFAGLRIKNSHVGSLDRCFFFDDATWGAEHRVWLGVLLDHIDPRNNNPAIVLNLQDFTTFALVFPRSDDYFVISFDLFHNRPLVLKVLRVPVK
ncbi:hypothetical protein MARINON1_40310 [Marinobacter salarius]|nr:hypothetical protein MBHK15_70171 [Marinobacter salarius]VXB25782.1 hypothetical protein MARINON1_40310 [Marinobacter salarius]